MSGEVVFKESWVWRKQVLLKKSHVMFDFSSNGFLSTKQRQLLGKMTPSTQETYIQGGVFLIAFQSSARAHVFIYVKSCIYLAIMVLVDHLAHGYRARISNCFFLNLFESFGEFSYNWIPGCNLFHPPRMILFVGQQAVPFLRYFSLGVLVVFGREQSLGPRASAGP